MSIRTSVATSKFNTVPSEDGTYVRFERDGDDVIDYDGCLYVFEGNTKVTGQYLIMKYRTDHAKNGSAWANTLENGHDSGKAKCSISFVADNEWHILIVDLARNNSTYVKPAEDGTYTIQWGRVDVLVDHRTDGYFDVAFIAYCDNLLDAKTLITGENAAICPHYVADDATYTETENGHFTSCSICGVELPEEAHNPSTPAYNEETKKYEGTCKCGTVVASSFILQVEADSTGDGRVPTGHVDVFAGTDEDGTTYARYQGTKTGGDPYFYLYRHGKAVTGQYLLIKYRVGYNAEAVDLRAGYTATSGSGATGKGDSIGVLGTMVADGDWHYMIVDLAKCEKFAAAEDGTYSTAFLRATVTIAELTAATEDAAATYSYLDVDFLGFADQLDALNAYVEAATAPAEPAPEETPAE